MDSATGFPNTFPLESDLSGGYRYPTFEQLGTGVNVGNTSSLPRNAVIPIKRGRTF